MTNRDALDRYLVDVLEVGKFSDYCPNGLQVEGRPEIRKVVSGVTASLALIEAGAAAGADALLVHHGIFWQGQDVRLVGWRYRRVAALMRAGLSLFAYHLPLDAHRTLGNNAQWGRRLDFEVEQVLGEQGLLFVGPVGPMTSAADLAALVTERLGRTPVLVPGDGRPLRRVAWCSGGAQGQFELAIGAGADAYLTGEISEPQAHLARETGVAFLACGHHATERLGAAALGEHVAAQFDLEHEFIDIDNPA